MPGRFLYILLVLSVAVPVQASSPYGRFHALVIGNQNYKELKSLKTPIADAKAVAEVLQNRYGFEVELVLDGNRKEIMRAFSTLRKTMTSEKDNLLIYYAGHGYLDRLIGVGYWQPVDAEQDNDIDWIPTSRVTNLLKVIQAKHALVVADSCYSGNLLMRESKAQLAPGMEKNAWLQRMLERRSRNALTAGGEEPVLDSGGGGHSVFAKAFLDVLRGNSEILDGDRLFDRIKSPVIANARQTPLYGVINMTGHDWGDFLLVPKGLQGQPPLLAQTEKRARGNFSRRGDNEQPIDLSAITVDGIVATSDENTNDSSLEKKPILTGSRKAINILLSTDPSDIISAHNKWRSQAGVPALIWSEKLARYSQNWANLLAENDCLMKHNINSDYGENIFWSGASLWATDGSASVSEVTSQDVINAWGSEGTDYDHENNTCRGVCGHYTQIVWKTTKEVGCGISLCDDGSQLWVCNYFPAGNKTGQRPY